LSGSDGGDTVNGMRFAIVVIAAALAAVLVSAAATAPSRSEVRPLPGLPAYTAGFERWLKLNRTPIPARPNDAHLGTKNVFVNRTRARLAPGGRQRFPYPYGSIIVKSIRRPGQRFVGVVAVMRKVRGKNPAHNDWVMIEYLRSSPGARFGELASGAVCTGCHVQVRRRDYVFTRLQRP
jgi:cytochrome P460